MATKASARKTAGKASGKTAAAKAGSGTAADRTSPEALTETLRAIDWFSPLCDDSLAEIVAVSEVRELERNNVLFVEGDTPSHVYIVLAGQVAISNASADGRESVLALLSAGEVFGEMGFLDGLGRSAQARTVEPSTIFAIPFGPLRKIYEKNPEVVWSAARLIARRLRLMDQLLADAAFLDVMGRTAKKLLELADGADEFELRITQEDLAGMVGASRERVNKAISTFVKLGWITQNNRRYTIKDRKHLEIRAS